MASKQYGGAFRFHIIKVVFSHGLENSSLVNVLFRFTFQKVISFNV